MVANSLQPVGNNITAQKSWRNYTPILKGQTEDPVATYTTQFGKYFVLNNICFFKFALVTSGTTTKTTLGDSFAVSLPFLSATNAGTSVADQFAGRAENATCINNAQVGVIASNVQQAIYQAYVIGTDAVTVTWAATGAGIGVLTHVLTAVGSGMYEIAIGG